MSSSAPNPSDNGQQPPTQSSSKRSRSRPSGTREVYVSVSANLRSVIRKVIVPSHPVRLFKVVANLTTKQFELAGQLWPMMMAGRWQEDYRRLVRSYGPEANTCFYFVKMDDMLYGDVPKWLMIHYRPEPSSKETTAMYGSTRNQTELLSLFGECLFSNKPYIAECFRDLGVDRLEAWVAQIESELYLAGSTVTADVDSNSTLVMLDETVPGVSGPSHFDLDPLCLLVRQSIDDGMAGVIQSEHQPPPPQLQHEHDPLMFGDVQPGQLTTDDQMFTNHIDVYCCIKRSPGSL